MSFLVGWIFGFCIGIGLIAAFVRYERIRSSRRTKLAATMAAFSRMRVEDAKKVIPSEYYPPWVVFTEMEKVNWFNEELEKIWPYVNEAGSELLRQNLEPMLEQYIPPVVESMKFSKFTLGSVAPQCTGVCIVEEDTNAEGITLELEVQWDGDPKVELDIKTMVGVSLPVQMKDIKFAGIFRIIFKPLVDVLPCFGAISYSLRKKNYLDFTIKIVGGEISAVPGISDAIESTIKDAVEGSITWPVRITVPILPGDYSDLELKPVGTLEVKLVQAKELVNKDLIGKSDPYAEIFVSPIREKLKRSKTINNQLNPLWNEHFEFTVEDESTQHLTVRIYDDEGIQSSELIGCARIELKELEPGKVKDVWLKLVKDLEVQRDTKYRGQVHLELLYVPYGTNSSLLNPFNPDFGMTTLEKAMKSHSDRPAEAKDLAETKKDVILRGVLSVTVISAENLPETDFMGKTDPYVKLMMKKSQTKVKTRVLNKTLNPVWEQKFDFVVEDPLHEMLVVEVWDHDTLKKEKIGSCIMTLTRVLLEREVEEHFPIEGTESGKIHLHLKWTPEVIFRDT